MRPTSVSGNMMLSSNNAFLLEIERRFNSVQQYEDKHVQQLALGVMPVVLLEQRAQQRMRALQTDVLKGVVGDVNVSIQEMVLLELLSWFKGSFFEWVDSPDCDYCGNDTKFSHMSNDPKLFTNTKRVEMHRCLTCSQLTPFFRYTNLKILLETREGRCGEWASVFTLFCRALCWETRFVCDQTDHVWTEVYSISQRRWLHCDPCENVCDNPLIYENGWGKKLSYIIAFSNEEIQDVTWRYSSNHAKVLKNRDRCSENELIRWIVNLRERRQKDLSEARRNYLTSRLLTELIDLMLEKKPNDSEKQGRASGSLAWRLQRGETTENFTAHFTWIPTESELSSGSMNVRYTPTLDRYEKITSSGVELFQLQKWQRGVEFASEVFRKEEKDWKMVYLCRKEGASEGEIKWRFETGNRNKVIDKVTVKFNRSVFENGQIDIQLCGENKCICFPSDQDHHSTNDLSGSATLTIIAVLKGGRNDCAWQHAQLFRQSTNNTRDYPFHVNITFKSK